MGKTLSVEKSLVHVALVGNPNAGKSSVFNRTTGLRQHVGNFPGVTVDKKTGSFEVAPGMKARLTDLPGTYSLYPTSQDEKIVLNILTNQHHPEYPDAIVYIADITQLERHLLLLTQVLDLQIPVVLGLNMMDIADREGFYVDTDMLSTALGGVPVVLLNGRTGQGVSELKSALVRAVKQPPAGFYDTLSVAPELISDIRLHFNIANPYRALLLAHHYQELAHLSEDDRATLHQLAEKHAFASIRAQVNETMSRFDRIVPLVQQVLTRQQQEEQLSVTDRFDRVLTHPVAGMVIFMGILFLMFQAIFAWASYPMDLIDHGIGSLNQFLQTNLPGGMLTDLLTEGIIAGLGGIIIFVPQIAILFLLISLLEESGYMARAVFLSDSVMRKFGLNGRSMVSLISGVACAIPAIMATRTITNWKERLITIFVTPLMSCSARIPVFTVLVALAVPQEYYWGFINLQGLVVMGLYLLGAGSAIVSAWVMKRLVKTRESGYFIIEMPSYKLPHWKNVAFVVYEKVKTFVVEAGQVILVISIILWFLASYGPGNQMEQAAEQTVAAHAEEMDEEQLEALVASRKLEASWAGQLGRFIEPAIKPLGFDWQIGIALITSFAAREVFIGTMATIYSVGDTENEETIIQRLKTWANPETGERVFTLATSFSLLIYYVFAMQCMSTLAVVKRETKSWKWPMLQLFYMTVLAYLASLATYQLLS